MSRADVALSPWSPCRGMKLIPELGWHFMWAKDENSCHSKSANRTLPQELKGHFILNSSYPASRHLIHEALLPWHVLALGNFLHMLTQHSGAILGIHSRVMRVMCLVPSWWDHAQIISTKTQCRPKHVIHSKHHETWIEGLKLKIKYFFGFFCCFNKGMEAKYLWSEHC